VGARHMPPSLYQRRRRGATKACYFSATPIPLAVAGRAIMAWYQRLTLG